MNRTAANFPFELNRFQVSVHNCNRTMSNPTAEDVEKIITNLESLLAQANDQYGGRTRSTIVPTAVKRMFGKGDVPELIDSAKGTIDNLRGIMDIDEDYASSNNTYLSDSAILAVNELSETLNELAAELENSHDATEMADAVDNHGKLLEKVAEQAKQEPTKDPTKRAIDKMQSSIDDAGLDRPGDLGKSNDDSHGDADNVTNIDIGGGNSSKKDNTSDDDPVGISVDDELNTIKDDLDLDD